MELRNNITGLSNLDKTFRNLPRSMQRKALIPALRAGGYVVRDLASNNVKAVTSGQSTGVLERGLGVYTLRKYKGNFRVSVNVKRKLVNTKKIINGKPVRVGLYGSVLEYRDGGKWSWLRTATRDGKSAAVNEITKQVNKGMVQAVKDARV